MNEQSLAVNKLFEDVFDGKIPARVPIMTNIDSAFCLDYAGFDLIQPSALHCVSRNCIKH